VRVPTDGHTDRLTDANRFNNLFHAICHSYGQIIKILSQVNVIELTIYLLLVSVQSANCSLKHKHLWTESLSECSK